MDLLTIKDVTKTFENTKAVDNISLNIPKQSIFGLLGPNGAGKTTLIRMITNILYQDSGTITLADLPPNVARHHYIGYMPEERGLYKTMKVGEQLLYLARLKNMSYQKAKTQIDYWLTKFEITDWWKKEVGELSKGMQQKIQFITTVLHQPSLIILDEPFSGLDPINANLIKDEIFNLKKQGATIIFSTHRMEQVEEICEQIALINKGKILLEGNVKDLKNRFKENKYQVNYVGELPTFETENINIIQQDKEGFIIQMRPEQSPNEALQQLIAKDVEVHGFNEILPSLNEIFIQQVSEN